MDYVIIVAGGKGLRMRTALPKQFIPVRGLPILMHTIRRFRSYASELGIILVLPQEQHAYWKELCEQYRFEIPCQVVSGGETRFHSVRNGLAAIPDETCGVIAVHDGVRPFVSEAVISACFRGARAHQAVIPVVPVTETLRHIAPGRPPQNVCRDHYAVVQTPQTFDAQILKKAYRQDYKSSFTDDASVVEAAGYEVKIVQGNTENIKITTPLDLKTAQIL